MTTLEVDKAVVKALRPKRTFGLGAYVLLGMFLLCLLTLPWSLTWYNANRAKNNLQPPSLTMPVEVYVENSEELGFFGKIGTALHPILGTDSLGRSIFWRSLLGGSVSLGIGLLAACLAMAIGTSWGLIAGYSGGKVDAIMMRIVDILYALPYILLVILLVVMMDGLLSGTNTKDSIILKWISEQRIWVDLVTLFVAIGAVSWLTLARVVRGQVLSLKNQPFIESARATGCGTGRILIRHVLPNLIGPIIVYTTLAVPQAILQESFLSFLGIGVKAPLPSWGNMAAEGLGELNLVKMRLWLLIVPCALLATTLLALNFMGDGLRDRFDPKANQQRSN